MFRPSLRRLVPLGRHARLTPTATHRKRLAGLLFGLSGVSYYIYTIRKVHSDAELDDFERNLEELRSSLTDPFVATRMALRRGRTVKMDGIYGIPRLDTLIVPSNVPCEDYSGGVYGSIRNSTLFIQGIFDGHNGPQTSDFLCDVLPGAVWDSLFDAGFGNPRTPTPEKDEYSSIDAEENPRLPQPPTSAEIDKCIKDAFIAVDKRIVLDPIERVFASPSKTNAVKELKLPAAGSCALLALYEKDSRELRVALTGDSRAVLGRRSGAVKDGESKEEGKEQFEVHVLSADQNAHNAKEEARMGAEHPGEKIMNNGRVLGWGLSRAFGNGLYKWSIETIKRLNAEYLGDRLPDTVKTPPYFTAEPEITTFSVKPGDFLIMATDGLWDCLTSEEAVGLVGVWLHQHAASVWGDKTAASLGYPASPPKTGSFESSIDRDSLPVTLKEDKTTNYQYWRAKKEFVAVDPNASAHLIRNAIGGKDRDLTEALLRMPPPKSRRYRDDISVVVLFFN